MAKLLRTNGVGSAQTTAETQDSKIKIYDSKADADLDLANIAENEIIATKAGESEGVVEVADTVEEDNPNPVSSDGVYDYVNDEMTWKRLYNRETATTTTVTKQLPEQWKELLILNQNSVGTVAAHASIPYGLTFLCIVGSINVQVTANGLNVTGSSSGNVNYSVYYR